MNLLSVCETSIKTPSFVLSLPALAQQGIRLKGEFAKSNTSLLYSVKAQTLRPALETLASVIDGFSVSSLFEARIARESVRSGAMIQYFSPCLQLANIEEIGELCDRISLNSYRQLQRHRDALGTTSEIGIRINPGMSFADDERYDPCRRNSKLGIPLKDFKELLREVPHEFDAVSGIHFHSNCESDELRQLVKTLHRVEAVLGDDLRRFRWLNVGGGYNFDDASDLRTLIEKLLSLKDRFNLELCIEPGAAIVRTAGYFVSTVEDIVEGEDYPVAILDFTVNHWPEIIEYDFEPDVEGHVDGGRFTYLLAGCSCLAGDMFGEYSFDSPLEIGSRLVFPNSGAYSIVKAHMFNGINLPSIYALTDSDELVLIKEFSYEDFLGRSGVDVNAYLGA